VTATDQLFTTPLTALHERLGARLVPFAGYSMPVQFPDGILAEHRQVRSQAGLFDVSHMGQAAIVGGDAAAALESVVPGAIAPLKPGRMRYTVLTNEAGGILDDLMVARLADDRFWIVINAARKAADLDHLRDRIGRQVTVASADDRALMALQGPQAAEALTRHWADAAALPFMAITEAEIAGTPALVSRSGYTGEDGFEISVPGARAEAIAEMLLAEPEVAPIGLGARDSLRLEAGLCLYGNDIDDSTTPVEADLAFTIGKQRRERRDFPGAAVILSQLEAGPERKRVGLTLHGRAPARAGTPVVDAAGVEIGRVTSGGFSPSLERPIAMAYVPSDRAEPGTALALMLRGKTVTATVTAMPFVPHRYYRGTT
jgi:aminomethyltransferase